LVKTALLFVDQSGWAVLSRASANHSRYTLIDTAMTFYAGQERCQRLGGHLVHINTIREQLFVEDFIRQMLQTTHQQGTYTVRQLSALSRQDRRAAISFCRSYFNVFFLSLQLFTRATL